MRSGKMTHIAIMVGGPEAFIPDISNLINEELIWIGVDRGAVRLLALGIQPAIALGDFDSITKEELGLVKQKVRDVRTFQAEKDATDTEIAVKIAFSEFNPTKVSIYGATGGRMDHFLNNLWLVFQPDLKPYLSKIHLIDSKNSLAYFSPGSYEIKKEQDKKYVAFICLTPVKKLTLVDAKYPLDEVDFECPTSLASNEFLSDTTRFSFKTGIVAVIQSKD